MKDDLANEDLAHLRALTEPKDDMLKRETPLPKASPVCPVCGLDRPHGHGQAELVSVIRELKADLAAMTKAHGVAECMHIAETQATEQVRADLAAAQAEVIELRCAIKNAIYRIDAGSTKGSIRCSLDAAIDAARSGE